MATKPTATTTCELRALTSQRCLLTLPNGKSYRISESLETLQQYLAEIALGQITSHTKQLAKLVKNSGGESAETATHTNLPELHSETPDTLSSGSTTPDFLVVGCAPVAPALKRHLQQESVDAIWFDGPLREAAHAVMGEVPIALVTDQRLSESTLRECETLNDLGVSWTLVEIDSQGLALGPQTTAGLGSSAIDAYYRQTAASFDHEVYTALQSPPAHGSNLPTWPQQDYLLGQAAKDLAAGTGPDSVIRFSLSGERSSHTVLPRPGYMPVAQHTWQSLIDPIYGVIKRIRDVKHHESIPKTVTTVQADVANMRHVGPHSNSVFCQGSNHKDQRSAYFAAIGESVERYCANIVAGHTLVRGSYSELQRKGLRALHPKELVLFSEKQYATAGFPFQKFDVDTPTCWSLGRCHTTGEDIWVPSSFVYVNWHTGAQKSEPVLNFAPFAGIAAGDSQEMAVVNGVHEILERHATMVWWLNGHPLPAITADNDIDEFFGSLKHRHDPQLVHLENIYKAPVAAGMVFDDDLELAHVGFSCKNTLREAAIKAWTEALTLQEGSRDLLNPDGAHWRALSKGLLAGRSYKKWRADRKYLDDFRSDFRDVDDLMVQQEVYLDPRARQRMSHLLRPQTSRSGDSVEFNSIKTLAECVKVLDSADRRLITVDVTTTDVAATGLTVQRSLIPGTVGNSPAAFPYLGNNVVQREAVSLGWVETAHQEEDLNYFPMPHA